MQIVSGTRLGPYEIVSPIGAGGMGEVFKARDTRLDRSVAIKLLSTEFSRDAQLRLRFEREAKTISQLNHPHVCTLYDVGREEGRDYLVMELLEGETLADRLIRGPLPLTDVTRYGVQIADALSKAHRQGIVHRDLKPANIMITRAGAKLLDFGLSKQGVIPSAAEREGLEMTEHKPLTREGTIIGTFQYMAPEQLEGLEADARTDIFGLGCVLYEMTTGKRAFHGKTKTSLIAAIVGSDPMPISKLQPLTPSALERVIRTCLEKHADDRWQSAHDVATELRWIAEAGPEAVPRKRRVREALAWGLVAAAVGLALWFASRTASPRPAEHAIRFEIQPPPNAAFNFAGRDAGPITVSPDGKYFAFVATTMEGVKRLYVRRIDSVAAQAFAGTEGASYPFWSADSQHIGFFADGKLKRIAAGGGGVRTLCDATAGRGGAWNREGTIIFAPSPYSPLFKVPANGGAPAQLTTLNVANRDYSHRWPSFLSDGQHFVYMEFSGLVQTQGQLIRVASLSQPRGTPLMQANSQASYVEPGFLAYVRDTNLMVIRFDPKQLRASGDAVLLAEHVQTYPNVASGVFSMSNTGVTAYQPAGTARISHLRWFDRQGKIISAIGAPDDYEDARLSPDERRVAVTRRDPDTGVSNIWIYDLSANTPTRFSYVPTFDHYPNWSPDGKQITFDSNRNGAADIYVKKFGEQDRLLYRSAVAEQPTDWSADGARILFQRQDPQTKWDLWILDVATAQVVPLLRTPHNDKAAQISPDGKWVVYTSDDAGRSEVYVSHFPTGEGRWQISSTGGGGTQPRWRRDGKEIFFLSADRKLMVAEVRVDGGEFAASPPQALFQTRARYTGETSYDVSADGQRFLINTMVFDEPGAPVNVIINWRMGAGLE